jgi:uridine kinase
MIERAVREINVDVGRSWLVGDTSVDVATARAAGLRSILVETGYAGLDRRCAVTPEFTVPDLAAAVDFILADYERFCAICSDSAASVRPGDFVFIGGLARSGKSNLSGCFKEALRRAGMGSIVLSLDRWLLGPAARTATVLGRYDRAAIRAVLDALARRTAPVELELPVYDKLALAPASQRESVRIAPADVIVIDGTIALLVMEAVPAGRRHALYVEIDEGERHRRVLREYELRGRDRAESEALYRARQGEESPIVARSAQAADHRIRMYLPADGPMEACIDHQ